MSNNNIDELSIKDLIRKGKKIFDPSSPNGIDSKTMDRLRSVAREFNGTLAGAIEDNGIIHFTVNRRGASDTSYSYDPKRGKISLAEKEITEKIKKENQMKNENWVLYDKDTAKLIKIFENRKEARNWLKESNDSGKIMSKRKWDYHYGNPFFNGKLVYLNEEVKREDQRILGVQDLRENTSVNENIQDLVGKEIWAPDNIPDHGVISKVEKINPTNVKVTIDTGSMEVTTSWTEDDINNLLKKGKNNIRRIGKIKLIEGSSKKYHRPSEDELKRLKKGTTITIDHKGMGKISYKVLSNNGKEMKLKHPDGRTVKFDVKDYDYVDSVSEGKLNEASDRDYKDEIISFFDTKNFVGYTPSIKRELEKKIKNSSYKDLRHAVGFIDMYRSKNKKPDLDAWEQVYTRILGESVNEAVKPSKTIDSIFRIAKSGQVKKVDGVLVDIQTANLVSKVWDQIDDRMKKKINNLDAGKLGSLVWKLTETASRVTKEGVKTTSLSKYKKLKKKGVDVELVTKSDVSKNEEKITEAGPYKDDDLNFLIDQLANSMEYYDKKEFMNHLSKETRYDKKTLGKIFDEYWRLGARERMQFLTKDWNMWLMHHKFNLGESLNEAEEISVVDERHVSGRVIIMLQKGANAPIKSAIFKNKRNADKFNRNKQSDLQKLYKLAEKTPYPKAIDEDVNEEDYDKERDARAMGYRNAKEAEKDNWGRGKKEGVNEEEDPCWDGYEQYGMKEKDGKKVPNCVPKNEMLDFSLKELVGIKPVNVDESIKLKGLRGKAVLKPKAGFDVKVDYELRYGGGSYKLWPQVGSVYFKDRDDAKDFIKKAKSGKTPFNKIELVSENITEDVQFKDGKYEFTTKDGYAKLLYNGKMIADGDFDADGYFMDHSSFRGQKFFDNGKEVIKYFKKKNITESINELKKISKSDIVNKVYRNDGNIGVVVKRDTKGMSGKQDKYQMYLVDDNYNVVKDLGTHPSKKGAPSKLSENLNEVNGNLNKKVLKYIDDYVGSDYPKGSPEYQWVVKEILKGALTDANFHSEAKKVDKYFSRAKDPFPTQPDMKDIIQDKGVDIAKWAKWDGFEIIEAFVFVVSMRIGRPVGERLENLMNENVNEAKNLSSIVKKQYRQKANIPSSFPDKLISVGAGGYKYQKTKDGNYIVVVSVDKNEYEVQYYHVVKVDGSGKIIKLLDKTDKPPKNLSKYTG